MNHTSSKTIQTKPSLWPELNGKGCCFSISCKKKKRSKTMASPITLPSLQGPLLRSNFLGKTHKLSLSFPTPKQTSRFQLKPSAKFDLFELLGGRGLCSGEKGIQQELKRNVEEQSPSSIAAEGQGDTGSASTVEKLPGDAFEKELMGLTGGFPGGEKGLQKFIEENPPPKKPAAAELGNLVGVAASKKPKPPELPVLMPGMIAIVSNPNNPYYMYCGIVQRITDGKAGVLFEGGNWDRLITFRLEELQRREKGPPMKNPKSCVLETMLEKDSQ